MTYDDLRHRITLKYGGVAVELSQNLENLVEVAKMALGEQTKDSVSSEPSSFADAEKQFGALFGG